MWIILALSYAALVAGQRYINKPLAEKLNANVMSGAMQVVGVPGAIILAATLSSEAFLSQPMPDVNSLPLEFWLGIWIQAIVIWPVQYYCKYRSLGINDISWVSLMGGLVPVIGGIVAWITLGDRIGIWGWTGIAVVIGGTFLLNLRWGKYDPRVRTWYLPAIQAVCAATSSVIAKYTAGISGVPLLLIVEAVAGASFQLVVVAVQTTSVQRRPVIHLWRYILIAGSVETVTSACGIAALSLGPVGQVNACFQTNMIIGLAIGIWLRGERLQPRQFMAALLVFSGIAIMASETLASGP